MLTCQIAINRTEEASNAQDGDIEKKFHGFHFNVYSKNNFAEYLIIPEKETNPPSPEDDLIDFDIKISKINSGTELVQEVKLKEARIDIVDWFSDFDQKFQGNFSSQLKSKLNSDKDLLVKEWNFARTSEWLEVNQIDPCFLAYFGQMTGEDLVQLGDMRNRAPEFYFQSLGKISGFDLKAITRFSTCLDMLFASN